MRFAPTRLLFGPDAPTPVQLRIDGMWTTFIFGGLDLDSLRERLRAWRTWAISGSAEPPPSLEPAPHNLLPLWIILEIWLGLLICLGFSSTLAAYASGGAMNVLAGLMSFAICTLLFAVFTVVTAGPARIWRNAIFWQAGWIVFVLVASWLGHLAITARWGR